MRSLYLVFWILSMVLDPTYERRCEERPLNIVIDSTNRTSRRNFNVQLAIINNVTSRLRRGAGDVTVLANIYQYNRNDMCRNPKASKCVKQSPNVQKPREISQKRVIAAAGLFEYNSTLTFERFSNQPFCLGCAEYLRVMLTHRYRGNGLGLILTTYPSMKKYIHSRHYDRYKLGGEYYLALLYNTTSPASRKVIARRSSNVSQIVQMILQTVCPGRFSPRAGVSLSTTDRPTTAPTTKITVKRLSENVTTTRNSSAFVGSLKVTESAKSITTIATPERRSRVETDVPLATVKSDIKSSPITLPAPIRDTNMSAYLIPSRTSNPETTGEISTIIPTVSSIGAPETMPGMPGTVQKSTTPIPSSSLSSSMPHLPMFPSVYLVTQSLASIPSTMMGISTFSLHYLSRGQTKMSTFGAKTDQQSVVSDLMRENRSVSHGYKSDYVDEPSTGREIGRSSVTYLMSASISLQNDLSVTPYTVIPSNTIEDSLVMPILITPTMFFVSHVESTESVISSSALELNRLGTVLSKTVYPSESVLIPQKVNFTSLVSMDGTEKTVIPSGLVSGFTPSPKNKTAHITFAEGQKSSSVFYPSKTVEAKNNSMDILATSVHTSFKTGPVSPYIMMGSPYTSSNPTYLLPSSSILRVNASPSSIFVTHAREQSISPVPTLNPAGVDSTEINSDITFPSPLTTPSAHPSRNTTGGVYLSQEPNSSSNITMGSSTTMFAHSSVSGYNDANTTSPTSSYVRQQSPTRVLHPGQTTTLSSATSPFNTTVFLVQKSQDYVSVRARTETKDTGYSSLVVRNATNMIHSTRDSFREEMTPSLYTASDALASIYLNQSILSKAINTASFKIEGSLSTSRISIVPAISTEPGGISSASIWMTEPTTIDFNRSVDKKGDRSLSVSSMYYLPSGSIVSNPPLTSSVIGLHPSASRPFISSSALLAPVDFVPAVVRNMQYMMEKKTLGNSTSFLTSHLASWLTGFITNTSTVLNQIEKEEEEEDTSLVRSRLVREKSLDFVEFVGNTTLTIGQKLPVGEKVNVTVDDLLVEIHAVNPLNFNGYTFKPNLAPKQQEKQPEKPQHKLQQHQQTVRLSPQLFKNSTIKRKVAITSLFMETIPAMRESRGNFRDIGKVLTISLDVQLKYPLPKTLTYTLHAPRNNFTNYKCVFWNQSAAWDTRGCHVTSVNGTLVTCECNHLTSFSILMQVAEFETHSAHAYVLSIISYIGCAISITGCILLMLTFTMCGRMLKVSRNVIHMNLALAMTISNGLFITADSVHMYRGLCLTVSIVMLYSYLASFFWMLVEGLHVYLMIVKVFKSPSMMKVYLIIGWLLPAVIVTVAGMKFHVNFTREDFCWISTQGNVIWVFVGPVLLVIGINIVILMKALSTSYKMAVAETAFLKLQETARLTMLLMPIFGLTWIFGLLAINKQMIVFQYLFTITNSLQGLYIFVCYCLMNNEVRTEFQRVRQKYSYGSAHSTSTESNSAYNPLFTKRAKAKSVVSMDNSNNVKLTRYDSVKTEMTSASSRASSMHYDSLAKRTTKGIELMKLNESFNESKDMEQPNDTFVNDTLSMSSSLCPEEHDYGVRLKYDHVPLTNGFHPTADVYTGMEVYQGNDVYSGSVDNHRSMSELTNGSCTYDTFRRRNENC